MGILRELGRSSAVLLSKELFCLVMSSELSLVGSATRRSSPSNSTRRPSTRPARETLLVFPSRVFPRTRKSTLVTSSMCRRMAILNPSRVSPALLLCRSTLVSSSLDMGKKTCGQKVENPPELSQYENAEVEFEPSQPLFVEPFETCAALGRIAVMDSNRLKMLGKVTGTVLSDL